MGFRWPFRVVFSLLMRSHFPFACSALRSKLCVNSYLSLMFFSAFFKSRRKSSASSSILSSTLVLTSASREAWFKPLRSFLRMKEPARTSLAAWNALSLSCVDTSFLGSFAASVCSKLGWLANFLSRDFMVVFCKVVLKRKLYARISWRSNWWSKSRQDKLAAPPGMVCLASSENFPFALFFSLNLWYSEPMGTPMCVG